MYCTNCGAANSDQADFCTTCGATLKAPEQQPQQTFAPPPPQQPQQAYAPPQQQPQQPYQGQAYPQQPAYGYPQQAPPKKKKTGLIIGIVAGVVVLAIVLGLVLSSGGGSKGGLVGKWAVASADYSSDFEEGLVLNFKSNGTLLFEAPKDTPAEMEGFYELMNMVKTKYKVSGDKLIMTIEFFGEKETSEVRFKIEGDTLTLYDSGSSPTTVLKRTK